MLWSRPCAAEREGNGPPQLLCSIHRVVVCTLLYLGFCLSPFLVALLAFAFALAPTLPRLYD